MSQLVTVLATQETLQRLKKRMEILRGWLNDPQRNANAKKKLAWQRELRALEKKQNQIRRDEVRFEKRR